MKLSEVPWDEIYVGMEFTSDLTGHKGKVAAKIPIEEITSDDNQVFVQYETGLQNLVWHFACEHLIVEVKK